jgi:DNA polymerase I-like protein with 3'-5' exonuclease and polymerase domains
MVADYNKELIQMKVINSWQKVAKQAKAAAKQAKATAMQAKAAAAKQALCRAIRAMRANGENPADIARKSELPLSDVLLMVEEPAGPDDVEIGELVGTAADLNGRPLAGQRP